MSSRKEDWEALKTNFNKGGHVIPILKDQTFRLFYENRREDK